MGEKKLKYIFYFFSASLLLLMLIGSRKAGINCDEVLHYDHSVAVYNYFSSHGTDKSALNTPETHLRYYGQSYDNLVTILSIWLRIDDVYAFRHLMSSLAGWLTIVVTATFAIWLLGYGAGITVLLLFALSPAFLGHSQNNLKDVPFALAYISGIFFILKFLSSIRVIPWKTSILLTLSVAFCISIRAGGLLLICYLFLFFFGYYLLKYLREPVFAFKEIWIRGAVISVISVAAIFLSILLWPYAQQDPLRNILESYRVMAHFPGTFRQLFEGKIEWSDNMPWYYLVKSMAITIPVVVLAGLFLLPLFSRKILSSGRAFEFSVIIFTVTFPVLFVIFQKSNLYSSWRQFLFVYPGIILLAASGFNFLFKYLSNYNVKTATVLAFLILAVHPVRFMIAGWPYSYLYYNELTGGVNGALGKYETDYYYVSQTEASEWLIKYLKEKGKTGPLKVKATYSVKWLFRSQPQIETSYFRFEERSMYDWDYAIAVNRYIPLSHLKNKEWPPENTIHVVYADSVPLCAVIERKSKNDYYGYEALTRSRMKEAINYFAKAVKENDKDEMIFYNFAAALYSDGQTAKADSVLKAGLILNPDFEPILMYLGNIAKSQNKEDEAIGYYERLIGINRKYFEAYVELAELFAEKEIFKAREFLRQCLIINPGYKPAISALAESYRKSDPDIAKKYDELLRRINNQ